MKPSSLYPLLALLVLFSFGARSSDLPPLRVGDQPGYTRVVLDLPKDATFQIEPLGAALRVTLPGLTLTPGISFVSQPELAGYVQEQHEGKAVVLLMTPQGVSERSGFKAQVLPALQGEGRRLVIDLSGGFVDTTPLSAPPSFAFIKAQGRRFSVLLDPGHGGAFFPGAVGFVTEKVVNLEVALRVRRLLEAAGVEVAMTRETDTAFSPVLRTDLDQRVRMAEGRSLFVSIHANAITPARADGWAGQEVYYYNPRDQRPVYVAPQPLTPSQAQPIALSTPAVPPGADPLPVDLAQPAPLDPGNPQPATEEPLPRQALPQPTPQMDSARRVELSRRLAGRVMGYLLGATAAANRGVRTADFYVIRYTTVPAILVEMGYVSHPLEGLALRDPNYQDRLAHGIARGVLEFLENDLE